jgi:hypothetical protein
MKEGLRGRNVNIPMTPEELKRWDEYLRREGLKRGGMIRKLVLTELERDESIQSGRTQIDPSYFQGRAE